MSVNESTRISKNKSVTDYGIDTVSFVERVVDKTGKRVDSYVSPVRDGIFKRFPTIFSLLVALGLAATFLGLEQILLNYQTLQEHPWLIFLMGIGILVLTGRLYKKLG